MELRIGSSGFVPGFALAFVAGLFDRPVSERCFMQRGVPLCAPCTLSKQETTLHLRPWQERRYSWLR